MAAPDGEDFHDATGPADDLDFGADLDSLFSMAEEDMAEEDMADDEDETDHDGGSMPNLLDEMMEAEEPEDETPVDEDILGMLEQIEGGWHDCSPRPDDMPENEDIMLNMDALVQGDSLDPGAQEILDNFEAGVQNAKELLDEGGPEAIDDYLKSHPDQTDRIQNEMQAVSLFPGKTISGNTPGVPFAAGVSDGTEDRPDMIAYSSAMDSLRTNRRGCNELVALLMRPSGEALLLVEEVVPPSQYVDLSNALVQLFDAFEQSPKLLNTLLSNQIHNTASEDILMRSESLGIRCLRGFLNIAALEYMQDFMKPQLEALLTSDLNIEIEPEDDEIAPGMSRDEAITEAATNLCTLVGQFLDKLEAVERGESSGMRVPWQIRYVMWVGFAAAKARFPGAEHHAASSMLFLRLITPVITMGGKNFKLNLDENLLRSKRRITTLVGKIVQYIANANDAIDMPAPLPGFIQERIARNKLLMEFMAGMEPMETNLAYAKPPGLDASLQPLVDFAKSNEGILTFEEGPVVLSELQQELSDAVTTTVKDANTASLVRETRGSIDKTHGKAGCCVIS